MRVINKVTRMSEECQHTKLTDIKEEVKRLENKKTRNRQGIRNQMLKLASENFLNLIKTLFNEIDRTQSFPRTWENYRIKSIKKKGKNNSIENQRGIFISNTMQNY